MADLAEIGFAAKTDELDKAKSKLEALTPAAAKAEQSSKKLSDTIAKSDSVLGKMASGVTGLGGSLKLLGPLLAGVAAGFAAAFGASALISRIAAMADHIDNVSKAARKLGTSVTQMQGLSVAAEMANSSFEGVATASTRMTVALAKAERAGKGNQGVFKLLGMSAKELLAMPIDTRLAAIADKLQKLGASSDDLLPILAQLGDRQGSLAALFEGGGDQIRQATDMVKRYGGALTDLQAQQVENMNDAWSAVGVAVGAVVTQLTAALAPILTTVFTSMAEGIGFVANGIAALLNGTSALIPVLQNVAIAMAIAFSPLIVATIVSIIASVASLIVAVGTGLVGAIYSAAAAMVAFSLSNPFTAILFGITTALAAIYLFRDEISKALGVDITAVAISTGNILIGAFVGAFNATAIVWAQLPNVIGDAAISAANYAISAIARMINAAIAGINSLITAMPDWMRGGSAGISFKMDEGDRFANQFAGAMTNLGGAIKQTMQQSMQGDWIGDFKRKMQAATPAVNGVAGAVKGLGDAALGAGGAGGGGGGAAKKLTELGRIAEEIAKLSEPFNQAKTAFDAAKTALDNGIMTNDAYAASVQRIQDAFMRAGGTAAQWGKITTDNTENISKSLEKLGEKTLNDLGNGFIDMALNGKTSFADMAKSIVKDLLKIMWQALIVKPLMNWFSTFSFGGGGAFGGAKASASAGSVAGFANGGAFTNSIVTKPTLFSFANGSAMGQMGEAGPEAIMPLKRGANGSLGVQAHGLSTMSNNNGAQVQVNIIHDSTKTNVREERQQNGDGTEIRNFIISTVNEATASGDFDKANSARYSQRPAKVTR